MEWTQDHKHSARGRFSTILRIFEGIFQKKNFHSMIMSNLALLDMLKNIDFGLNFIVSLGLTSNFLLQELGSLLSKSISQIVINELGPKKNCDILLKLALMYFFHKNNYNICYIFY